MNFVYGGRPVRMIMRDGEPWWVLTDVCGVLGISNSRDVAARLDDDEKGVDKTDTLMGFQSMTIINESGLYSVILRSSKPEAKAFKRWITHEVLPQIKRTGMYLPSDGRLSSDFMFKIAERMAELEQETEAQKLEIAQKTAEIAEMQPKVTYYEHVLNSPGLVKTKVIASDFGLTAQKLNRILADAGFQYKQGKTWHLYAEYLGMNYAKYKTTLHDPRNPDKGTSEWMYWTQTGRLAIYDLLKGMGIPPIMERESTHTNPA